MNKKIFALEEIKSFSLDKYFRELVINYSAKVTAGVGNPDFKNLNDYLARLYRACEDNSKLYAPATKLINFIKLMIKIYYIDINRELEKIHINGTPVFPFSKNGQAIKFLREMFKIYIEKQLPLIIRHVQHNEDLQKYSLVKLQEYLKTKSSFEYRYIPEKIIDDVNELAEIFYQIKRIDL